MCMGGQGKTEQTIGTSTVCVPDKTTNIYKSRYTSSAIGL